MNNTRLSRWYLLPVLLMTLVVRAADAPASATAAKRDAVIAKFVEALGGKAAIERVTNRVSKASAAFSGMTAEMEFWAQAPDRQATRVELAGMGTMQDGYDGRVAWSQSPFQGYAEKAGDELAKAKRDSVFHQPLQLAKVFAPLEHKGTETAGGESTEVLEGKLSGGTVERFYFSAQSGLLVRRVSEFEAASGRVKVDMGLADYKAVGGLKEPHVVRLKIEAGGSPVMEMEIKISQIRHNVPIPDAVFSKPPA